MDIVTESERKYDLPEAFAAPDLAKVGRLGEPQIHDLDATYFDTDDLRLARHRITLRRRTGGTDAGWHLKTPGSGADRTEHRLPLSDRPENPADRSQDPADRSQDPADRSGEDVPAALLAEVRAVVRGRPVRPVARLRTRRREFPLHDSDGRVLALIAHDTVRAEAAGTGQQRWRELEVELVDGDSAVLDRVEKRLLAAGARPAAGPSKLARALGDRLGASRADRGPGPDRPAAVRAVLDYVRAQRDAIVARDPGVRRGDPDAVHAMRVATRRLRSTLRNFPGLWAADRAEALGTELSWLADRLGGVRDTQVMAARLHRAVADQPPELIVGPVDQRISEHLDADLARARQELGEALDGQRYLRLLDLLDALVDTGPQRVRGGSVRRQAAGALRRADRRLDGAAAPPRAGAAGPPEAGTTETPEAGTAETPHRAAELRHERDERLHAARRAYKRARYAVEALAPLAGKPASRLARRLTGLQDVLGEHQDAVITAAVLREYAGRAHAAGDDSFSYGILTAGQLAAAERALGGLAAARRAAGQRKLRRWLR